MPENYVPTTGEAALERLGRMIADELETDSAVSEDWTNGKITATGRRVVEFAVKPWLAAQDAEVAVKALEEAADELQGVAALPWDRHTFAIQRLRAPAAEMRGQS